MSGARQVATLALVAAHAAVSACGQEGDPVGAGPEDSTEIFPPPLELPAEPPVYAVAPPAGTLPWPQHDPDFGTGEYESMLAELWVVNNFGLYQGGSDRNSIYLHSGIDIVLPQFTPVRAVEAGTIRADIGGTQYYRTLIVEDADEPGLAWGYTHVYFFPARPGTEVFQGSPIGRVNFSGLQHVHLDRFRLREGGDWTRYEDLVANDPQAYFAYEDTEAPVFEGPFRYVLDGTDEAFLPTAPAEPVAVSGAVDVVAGIRDPGEWARSHPDDGSESYGDRNAPTRIEWRVTDMSGIVRDSSALDFARFGLAIDLSGFAQRDAALRIYQHYEAVRPEAPDVGDYNRRYSFFRVNHMVRETAQGTLEAGFVDGAWRTADTMPDGTALFPNGLYAVTVRAIDGAGNTAERTDTVRVAN